MFAKVINLLYIFLGLFVFVCFCSAIISIGFALDVILGRRLLRLGIIDYDDA